MSTIDVIVATYNRHDRLERCLRALSEQTVGDFQIIVVDDNSDDPVAERLPVDLRESGNITLLRTSSNRGPAHARNIGVQHSSAEFIAFVDDDVVPDRDLLRHHLEHAVASKVPVVQFGPLLAPADWKPTAWNLWEAATLKVQYDRMSQGVYAPTWRQFFTGNAFLRRADFVRAGGFNESFTRAEDIELAYRLSNQGCAFAFIEEAKGWHYAERSLSSWLAIPRQYAHFDAELDRLYPGLLWLERVRGERQGRHPLARLTNRTAARSSVVACVASNCAIVAARMAHRFRADKVTVGLLSLAYSMAYERSLRHESRMNAIVGSGSMAQPEA